VSDFFELNYQRPVLSPVIKITKSKEKPTFVSDLSDVDKKDMFSQAIRVRNLMKESKLSLMKTAKLLGLDSSGVANKLRLLEFDEAQRKTILQCGYSEKEALCFLQLDKNTRLYAMELCRQENYSEQQIEQYVKEQITLQGRPAKKLSQVSDVGFLSNSLKKTLLLAEKMGFETDMQDSEDDEYHYYSIKVKRKHGNT